MFFFEFQVVNTVIYCLRIVRTKATELRPAIDNYGSNAVGHATIMTSQSTTSEGEGRQDSHALIRCSCCGFYHCALHGHCGRIRKGKKNKQKTNKTTTKNPNQPSNQSNKQTNKQNNNKGPKPTNQTYKQQQQQQQRKKKEKTKTKDIGVSGVCSATWQRTNIKPSDNV